jgi:hypothetical protein
LVWKNRMRISTMENIFSLPSTPPKRNCISGTTNFVIFCWQKIREILEFSIFSSTVNFDYSWEKKSSNFWYHKIEKNPRLRL